MILTISTILIYFVIKKIIKKSFDNCVGILIFFIGTLVIITIPKNTYLLLKLENTTNRYKETYNINVSKETETPNIYWIHCDAMMNFEDMEKYFRYDNIKLKRYLQEEKFTYNSSAYLISNHQTQRALAALFNPKYYDTFLQKYLYDVEKHTLGATDKISYNISTKELVDKRFNNELMTALKEKGYTTIGITKFNNYSSVKTDIIYDYYNFTDSHWHFTKTKELRQISSKSIEQIEKTYNNIQIKEFLSYSIFSPIIDKYIPYEYELIDYNELNLDNYSKINNSEYWQAKAILKSIDKSKSIQNNKFYFIDYDLNHPDLSFDAVGNKLNKENSLQLNNYVGNYIYSTDILIDIVNYIKDNDNNAIIILQGDHGLHSIESEDLKNYLEINQEEVQEIRNSVINAIYIPEKYQTGEESYLSNPLNISRYLVNNFVGKNYEYIEN